MLEVMASLLRAGLEPLFCLMLAWIHLAQDGQRRTANRLVAGAVAGAVASVIMLAINTAVVRLEMGDVVEKGLVVCAIACFFVWVWLGKRSRDGRAGQIALGVLGFAILLDKAGGVINAVAPALSLENGLSSEWVIHLAGVALGLVLFVLLALAMKRIAGKVGRRVVFVFLLLAFAQLFVYQLIEWAQMLFGLQILPLTMWALDVLTPLVNHKAWFFYGLLALLAVYLLAVTMRLRVPQPVPEAPLNPAQQRKRLAQEARVRRWFYSLAAVVTVIFGTVIGDEVKAARATDEQPTIPVTADHGHIHIPKADLKEKELNVYSCTMDDGTEVKFIAVRKAGENYGVALDACQICGAAGYYQKDGQIICKKCGSVVSPTTIGFMGGCNPIPLMYEQKDDGTLDILVSELEKVKDRFK